jgi:pilus assembly protein Flp/PilA
MLPARLTALLHDDTGATATEYALIACLIAVAAASAFASLGNELGTTYGTIETEVSDARSA